MFKKGKDLSNWFPEMEVYTQEILKSSNGGVWGFRFIRKPSAPGGNFFRYRGQLTNEQIQALIHLHRMPTSGSQMATLKQNGTWNEYSSPLSMDMFKTDKIVALGSDEKLTVFLNQLAYHGSLLGRVFVNGREIENVRHNFQYLERNDVVVFVQDEDQTRFGSSLDFKQMPTLEVYKEKLSGPYYHPDMIDRSPSEISYNTELARVMRLQPFDDIVCQKCGRERCSDHYIQKGGKVFVRRDSRRPKLYYEVQSARLINRSATDSLVPFSLVVLDRGLRASSDWPDEIETLKISGKDVTGNTCGVEIESTDSVDVYLRDPRIG